MNFGFGLGGRRHHHGGGFGRRHHGGGFGRRNRHHHHGNGGVGLGLGLGMLAGAAIMGSSTTTFSRPDENNFRFPSDFYEKYRLGVLIGDGASCEVHECMARLSSSTGSNHSNHSNHSNNRYAVKRVPKRYFSSILLEK